MGINQQPSAEDIIRYRVDSDDSWINGRTYRTLEDAREAIRSTGGGEYTTFAPEEGIEGWNHDAWEGCATSVISEVRNA